MVAMRVLSTEALARMVERAGIGIIITMEIGIGMVGMVGEFLFLPFLTAFLFLPYRRDTQRLSLAATHTFMIMVHISGKCHRVVFPWLH